MVYVDGRIKDLTSSSFSYSNLISKKKGDGEDLTQRFSGVYENKSLIQTDTLSSATQYGPTKWVGESKGFSLTSGQGNRHRPKPSENNYVHTYMKNT